MSVGCFQVFLVWCPIARTRNYTKQLLVSYSVVLSSLLAVTTSETDLMGRTFRQEFRTPPPTQSFNSHRNDRNHGVRLPLSPSLTVYLCLSLYLSVSHCISLSLAVNLCLSLYLPVSRCVYIYIYAVKLWSGPSLGFLNVTNWAKLKGH